MTDKTDPNIVTLGDQAKLIASVSTDDFGKALLDYVSTAAVIRNFGTFYFADLRDPRPVLSVWSGKISDYWFRNNAADILSSPQFQAEIRQRIALAPADGVHFELWRPPEDDFRHEMYRRVGMLERIAVASRRGRSGYQSFFLRSAADGSLQPQEIERLRDVLPVAHELIGLRHRIVGSEAFQFTSGLSVSSLRERGVQAFEILSRRESEICDCIVRGLTVEGTAIELGIAGSSVRTLRQRAYRKLGINSAGELMALIINDRTNLRAVSGTSSQARTG
ncbi:LuxR family transcriptional regulator [Nitratireductor sp. XY-223]|uniref:helix-turn-helix transcriptional regulator n=1 Tax=Nitratireductor sp. XY-223 TaxID=2561926 RepID=UPI0010AA7C09|nr:LuxR family transcriptional regulator [Nitratireductor sp. XY-223]